MSTNDLGVVLALDEAGSFSGAARLMGVAHTTISRKLRALEEHYQTRLFEASGDGGVLTAEGERLAASARRIEAELGAVERDIIGRDHRLAGKVTLTTVDILAWHYMPTLAAFRTRYPDISLAVETGAELRSLSRREAEMALRLSNAPDEYLFGRRVGRFSFCPYVAAPLAAPGTDLPSFAWLEYSARDCAGPANRWLDRNVPSDAPRGSVPTPLAMLRAVSCGLGAGLLPRQVADTMPELVRLSDTPAFEIDVWLLTAPEIRNTARIRAVFSAFA